MICVCFFKGTGTNENALIEILASRNSKQMKEVSQAYYKSNYIVQMDIYTILLLLPILPLIFCFEMKDDSFEFEKLQALYMKSIL